MIVIDDRILMSYVDGELDEATTREFEAQLTRDAALRAAVDDYRQNDSLLRAAFKQSDSRDDQAGAFLLAAPGKAKISAKRWGALPLALAASIAVLAIGAVTGLAVLDSLVEREFDRRTAMNQLDLLEIDQTRTEGLEKNVSGTEVRWKNPENGNFGLFLPVQTWRTKAGQFCREFEESTSISGVSETEYGVACRGKDGQWKVRIRYYPG